MTSHYSCKKCGTVFGVPLMDKDIKLLKRRMRCPNSLECGGQIYLIGSGNVRAAFPVTQLTALQLYQATMGVGLPAEKKCSPTDIKKLLVGARIVSIQADKSPDPKRSIIHSLTLDNGKQVHLAPSTKGATIYRVTEVRHGR